MTENRREEGEEEEGRAIATAAMQQQMQCLQQASLLDMQLHGKLMDTHTHIHKHSFPILVSRLYKYAKVF